jgi:hypothetical protein
MHKKDGGVGKIRVNVLAREVGIKSRSILAYLAELGYPKRSHSSVIDGALSIKVREHFGPIVRLGGPEVSQPETAALEGMREHRQEVQVIPPAPSRRAPVATQALQKCPECGVSMRVDRLPRHLRRAHTILIDHLARELGIKSKPILAYLAELGYPLSPSYTIDGTVAVKVRVHFGKTADGRGDMKTPPKPEQASQGLEFLRAKVAELEAELSKRDQVPSKLLVSSAGVPVERFSFKLLPPGTWDIDDVIKHYHREADRFPADLAGRKIDEGRLRAMRSLNPCKCYVGTESWLGYVVFEFLWSSRVVLECPFEGNAIYVLWGDWKRMVTHTKHYIWRNFPQNYSRIVHRGKGGWLAQTRGALKRR